MEVRDNLKERVSAIGSKLKIGGAEVSRKVSARMTVVGGRMKELFQAPSPGERLVEEATAANLRAPDWAKLMEICDMLNDRRISGQDVVRGVKKRIATRNAGVQLLALTLLETCVKNHEKMFSEMASERLLDEMVKMAEDPQAWPRCRDKALAMIEAWGESEELRYLPIYEETYKSMRERGVRFPGRDPSSLSPIFTPKSAPSAPSLPANTDAKNLSSSSLIDMGRLSASATLDVARNSTELLSSFLTSPSKQDFLKDELTVSLVEQCKQALLRVQQIAQRSGENDAVLFEALTVNDELQKVLEKFQELSAQSSSSSQQTKPAEPAVVTAYVLQDGATQSYDPLSDLDDDEENNKLNGRL